MLLKNLDKVFDISAKFLAPSLFGLLIGYFLKNHFNNDTFLMAFFLAGVITGVWSSVKEIWKIVKNLIK